MKIKWRHIVEFGMKLRGAKKIDIELYRLRRNMAIDDFKLEEMDRIWADEHMPCCPACMWGKEYNDLLNKQDRRREMEKILLARKSK